MDERHARALQRVRALLLAGLVLSLAAGAHVVAGGDLPPPLLLGLLAVLSLAAASSLGRRRLRRRSLVPALTVGQALLHSAFAALAVPASAVGTAGAGAHAGHVHGSVLALTGTPGAADAAVDAASAGMLLAHALATTAAALVVVSADGAWNRAVVWLTHLFPALAVLLAGPVAAPATRTPRLAAPRPAAALEAVLVARPHRGPPAVVPAV